VSLQTTFTPADFEALAQTDLSGSTCVVLDILRATSSMITALANGAEQILPVATIEEALAAKAEHPEALLCGERDGLRITAVQTGGTEFDLGNSPREYTAEIVAGKTLISTTTNGTRALRACANAEQTLVASFLNLTATTDYLRTAKPNQLVIVCGGTYEEAALEDTLAAGAIADALWEKYDECDDATQTARLLFNSVPVEETILQAKNAQRLLSIPDLADDVSFSLRPDAHPLLAAMGTQGWVQRLAGS
jgi:2-phosphosulfolactate phosphatase